MSDGEPSSLFRPEVLNSKSGNSLGCIRLSQPISTLLITIISAILAISLISFSYFGFYTKKARISGITVPIGGTILLNSPSMGFVKNILVKEGQLVSAGTRIMEIGMEREGSDGEISSIVEKQLNSKKNEMENEVLLRIDQHNSQLDTLKSQIKGVEQQISQIETEISISNRRLQLANKAVAGYRKLQDEGFMSGVQAQQKQEEYLDIESKISSLKRGKIELISMLNNFASQKKTLQMSLNSDQIQTKKLIISVQQELAENKNRRSNYIVATTPGVISTLNVENGQNISGNQALATILPISACKDSGENILQTSANNTTCLDRKGQLEVHLYAPSRTAGFVVEGQEVLIRYDAYPYQKFGLQKGKIINVSRTPFSTAELPIGLASSLNSRLRSNNAGEGEGLYRIKARLDSQNILLYGVNHHLKPGLMLEAEVSLDKRQVWEWIFEPVIAMHARN